ncbi:uncharacterized protein LOC120551081 [Perca fluviatilis]|uniref:uncharacterized protein LOC120551081 n=1 Tax=Perca fluviatilis TaxID=8168 RepID=UPI00196438FC|nr:uncharacterized protein LOC120551081 [Perca fluviatilis]
MPGFDQPRWAVLGGECLVIMAETLNDAEDTPAQVSHPSTSVHCEEPVPEADLLLDNLYSFPDQELNSSDTPAQVSHPSTSVHCEEPVPEADLLLDNLYSFPDQELNSSIVFRVPSLGGTFEKQIQDTPAQVSHHSTGVHFEEQLAAYEEKVLAKIFVFLHEESTSSVIQDTPAQVSHPSTGVHFEEQLATYEEKVLAKIFVFLHEESTSSVIQKPTVYARPLLLPRNPRPDKRPNVFKWSSSPTPRTPLHPIPKESGTPEEEEAEEEPREKWRGLWAPVKICIHC